MKKRVLLIGAGARIQNNFIPALTCLNDSFEIVGVYSRTEASILRISSRWGIAPVTSLKEFDFKSIDVVLISITTTAVPEILNQLDKHAGTLELIIDTPIFGKLNHFKSIPLLKKYKRVTVAEDYMNFPVFQLMRDAVEDGVIGKVKKVCLFHNAFSYHGTALIRSFVNFKIPATTKIKPICGSSFFSTLTFTNGVTGVVTMPYVTSVGHTLIVGEKGVLSDFPPGYNESYGKQFFLTEIRDSTGLTGFEITADDFRKVYTPPFLSKLKGLDFDNKTDFNLQKTCGLIEVIKSTLTPNINSKYGIYEGLYDSFLGKVMHRASYVPGIAAAFFRVWTKVLGIRS